jgi:hypothetical protein
VTDDLVGRRLQRAQGLVASMVDRDPRLARQLAHGLLGEDDADEVILWLAAYAASLLRAIAASEGTTPHHELEKIGGAIGRWNDRGAGPPPDGPQPDGPQPDGLRPGDAGG